MLRLDFLRKIPYLLSIPPAEGGFTDPVEGCLLPLHEGPVLVGVVVVPPLIGQVGETRSRHGLVQDPAVLKYDEGIL